MNQTSRYEVQLLLTAIMFYTRLPVPSSLPYSQDRLNRSRKYFPLIGIIIGLIAAFCYCLSSVFVGTSTAVLLSMCATILATGAFHEDGFADTCDGLGGGWGKDNVLTIMKDSRIGTYGSIGLFALLAVKATTLIELAELGSLSLFFLIYLCGHTVSRQLSSSAIDVFDYVQDIDQSKVKPVTENRLSSKNRSLSYAISAVVIFAIVIYQFKFVFALLFMSIVAWYFLCYCRKRIGGYTGDILGATQQLSEVSFYVACLAVL